MASWAAKRKFTYLSIFILVVVVIIGLPTFFIVYKAPSCVDNKQNQGEFGIDCGGPCRILCKSQTLPPIVIWQRAFPVNRGVYNAVAYVENPNLTSGVASLSYVFNIYDAKNVKIYERKGKTMVPPKKIFPIFEPNIVVGESIPATVTFAFTEEPVWMINLKEEPKLDITSQNLQNLDTSPRLDARIENHTLIPVSNIEVVAVLFDESDNAIAASATRVDSLRKNATQDLVFTWPVPWRTSSVSKIDIIPKIYPGVNY